MRGLINPTTLEGQLALLKLAQQAASFSYSPYSKFSVGAVVLTGEQAIFSGTNIENLSYGLTICAERVAIANAISQGQQSFLALAVWAARQPNGSVMPCGACRQVVAEFFQSGQLIITSHPTEENRVLAYTVNDLLPSAFSGILG